MWISGGVAVYIKIKWLFFLYSYWTFVTGREREQDIRVMFFLVVVRNYLSKNCSKGFIL